MTRHEVHSLNTHTLCRKQSIKTDKTERSTRHWSRRNHWATVHTLFATALWRQTTGLQTHSLH